MFSGVEYAHLGRGDRARRNGSGRKAAHLAAVGAAALSAALGWGGAGLAADAAEADEENGERIIVTGSRVARTGFDAPTPVTVMDAELAENLGIVNVGDSLRRLPQNTAFFTETNVGLGNFNVGAQLANLRGLNPFFGTRTLTLVDTRRVVPSSEGGAIDLTLIPSMLVGRTEVVTGGASAAYGSDAIAGVVNVILDTELDGGKAQFDVGQTFEGDGGDAHASIAWGAPFAEGRGHLLLGGEYQTQESIGLCAEVRDWCAESWAQFTNAGFNTPAGVGNGQPNFVIGPNAKSAGYTETGVLTPTGGAPLQFNDAGTELLPFDPGMFSQGFVFSRQGGDGELGPYSVSTIRPEITRYSLLAHARYELTPSIEGFVEVAYAHSETENFPANGGLGPFNAAIADDNAFLTPEALAAAPDGGTFTRFYMPDVFSARNTTETDINRFVAGLEGDLVSDWEWDAYYQYGTAENSQRLFHNSVGGIGTGASGLDFLNWAVDAVDDGSGNIVCRQVLLGNPDAAGCVPLNAFGLNNADPDAIDYVFRTLKEDTEYTQNVLGANVRGTLFDGWAGPIAGAFGAEWRKDEVDVTHDIANQPWYDSYFLSYGGDRGGEIEVIEAYGEVDLPVLRDQPFAKLLQVNLAARQTRNEATSALDGVSNSHDFSSWKLSSIYDVNDWLRFRGTLSRDVRAGGFRELFLPPETSTNVPGPFGGGVNNPWNGNAAEEYVGTTGGNPDLMPEEADTTTFGVVLTPSGALDGLRLSADWYEVDLGGAIIVGPGAQALVDVCFDSGGTSLACDNIEGFGTDDITAIDSRAINIGAFLTRGYDFEASYNMPLSRLQESWSGDVNVRVIASYLYDMIIDTGLGDEVINYAGQTGPTASFWNFNTSPEWRTNLWLTYSRERFSATLEAQHIDSGIFSVQRIGPDDPAYDTTLVNSINDNTVEGRTYYSLSASYDVPFANGDRSVEVFGVINNLFDEEPPVAPGGNGFPTNPVYFDTLGARFRVGARIRF